MFALDEIGELGGVPGSRQDGGMQVRGIYARASDLCIDGRPGSSNTGLIERGIDICNQLVADMRERRVNHQVASTTHMGMRRCIGTGY